MKASDAGAPAVLAAAAVLVAAKASVAPCAPSNGETVLQALSAGMRIAPHWAADSCIAAAVVEEEEGVVVQRMIQERSSHLHTLVCLTPTTAHGTCGDSLMILGKI